MSVKRTWLPNRLLTFWTLIMDGAQVLPVGQGLFNGWINIEYIGHHRKPEYLHQVVVDVRNFYPAVFYIQPFFDITKHPDSQAGDVADLLQVKYDRELLLGQEDQQVFLELDGGFLIDIAGWAEDDDTIGFFVLKQSCLLLPRVNRRCPAKPHEKMKLQLPATIVNEIINFCQ